MTPETVRAARERSLSADNLDGIERRSAKAHTVAAGQTTRRLVDTARDVVPLCDEVERLTEALRVSEEVTASVSAVYVRIATERDEARSWVRRLTATDRVLTCVYCGEAYPPGSPTHGAEVLTAHVKVCAKHPMREAEAKVRGLLAVIAKARGLLTPLAAQYDGCALGTDLARVLTSIVCGAEPTLTADDADPDGHAADDAANARLGL